MMDRPGIRDLALFLKRVMASRALIDPQFTPPAQTAGHGYEIVEDLLLNAERRAATERYDDAIGRLYRALELTAQIRLFVRWQISTADVDLAKVPPGARDRFAALRSGPDALVKIALHDAWSLLAELGDPEISPLYRAHERRLLDALQKRNASLFAHGFCPLGRKAYESVSGAIAGFIRQVIAAAANRKQSLAAVQFPQMISPLEISS